MNRTFRLLPIALFTLMAIALGLGLGHNPRELPSMFTDKPAPAFALPPLIKEMGGLKSADLARGDITLLNVFASWCGGCRYEHPLLMQIATDKRFKMAGINWKDEPDKGKKWIGDYGNPYQLIGDDSSGRTGIDLGVTGVPETFVIDSGGRIRFRYAGPLTPEVWKKNFEPVIAEIEKRSRG